MDQDAATEPPADRRPGTLPRLETPLLEFGRVPIGHSAARAVTLSGPVGDIEVVEPPLAPFSVMSASVVTPPAVDGEMRAAIWVRYDADRSMGRDRGRLVLASRSSGHRWTVELSGAEALAR